MKAPVALNFILAVALVLLCAKLHFMAAPAGPAAAEAPAAPVARDFHGADKPSENMSKAVELMFEALSPDGIAAAAPSRKPGDAGRKIALPQPRRYGGMALSDALSARRTVREFSPEPLSDHELSDLLWAANGYNRHDERKRTAPTAINRQEFDIYVLRADGAYFWDSEANALREVSARDLRGFTGRMNAGDANFALQAPVALVFVADFARQGMADRRYDAIRYACVDAGFIGQNVYLHCAANGLGTVFLGSLAPEKLAEALGLPKTSVAIFAQTVGKVR
ncbi:MAG: SagB/ThcOx family dehydrogenase [Kiritimatiellae bacterium]|nr:SagB/ThcOx family dehydrogenase [Kiritimatiellia bacterium]